MANPQKEAGYTPIANELLEQVYRLKLNGTQFKILMVIWRFTYGFSRKEYEMSEGYIAKAAEINRKQVSRELKELIDYKIVSVIREATHTTSRVITFNKHYDTWEPISRQCTNVQTVSQLEPSGGSELVDLGGSFLDPQDKQVLKQINKTSTSHPQKHKYGGYQHVLLTDEEKDRLIAEYGQDVFDKCITKLDEYIEVRKPKYNNHNLVIRKWVVGAVKEDEAKKGGNQVNGETKDTSGYYTADYYNQFKSGK